MNKKIAWRFAQIICFVLIAMLAMGVPAIDARAIAVTSSQKAMDVLKAQPNDPTFARGALREANAALDAAVKSRNWKSLFKAVNKTNTTRSKIIDLNLENTLKQELLATKKKLYVAQGLLLTLLKDSCPRRVEHGLVAAQLLRVLNATQRAGIGSATIKAVEKGLDACLRFELQISSRITNAKLRYEVLVDIIAPLRWNMETGVVTGSGPIKMVQQFMRPVGSCTVKLTHTLTEFEITRMTIDVDIDSITTEAKIEDIKLSRYTPGPLIEKIFTTCPSPTGSITVPGELQNWGKNFLAVHAHNKNIVIEGWSIGEPSGVVGVKVYRQQSPRAILVESSDFILVHKPTK